MTGVVPLAVRKRNSPSLPWRLLRSNLKNMSIHGVTGGCCCTRDWFVCSDKTTPARALPSSRSGRTVRGPRCGCRSANPLLHDAVFFLTSLHCFAVAACTTFAAAFVAARVAFMPSAWVVQLAGLRQPPAGPQLQLVLGGLFTTLPQESRPRPQSMEPQLPVTR